MEDHGWHLFDVERGYEVKREKGKYQVRKMHEQDAVVTLDEEEFEQFRQEGVSPKGLE